MLRRWFPRLSVGGLPVFLASESHTYAHTCANNITVCRRGVGERQPRAKQWRRFTKAAMMQSRARSHVQKGMAALRQQINEEHGEKQRQCAQLRRRCERAAASLVDNAKRGTTADALEAARHMFALQEATRKAMKGGKNVRKALFANSKRWRG